MKKHTQLGDRRKERRKYLRRKNDAINTRLDEFSNRLAQLTVAQHAIEFKVTAIESMLDTIQERLTEIKRSLR